MERMLKKDGGREAANARRIAQGKFSDAASDVASRMDGSPMMIAQRKRLQGLFGGAVQLQGAEEEPLQGKFETAQRVEEEEPLQGKFETAQRVEEEEPLQGKFETAQRVEEEEPLQGRFPAAVQLKEEPTSKPNNTGLPDSLKSGIENLSGMSMDAVKVHYNSSQPAQLNALAYAQGKDIHVAPGQEQHLPHEAWHVVQQAQGRVKPTMQMKEGVPVNDDAGLEREADVMGAKAMQMRPAGLATTALLAATGALSPVQREGEPDWDALPTRGRSNAVFEGPGSQEALPSDGQGQSHLGAAEPESEAQAPLPLDVNSTAHLGADEPSMSTVAEHARHQEERQKLASVVEKANTAKEIGSQTSELAGNIDKVQNAPKVESNSSGIFDHVKGAYDKFKESTLGKAFSLVSPIVSAAQAILGMKEKWHIWSVFEKTATVTGSDGKKTINPNAPPEAKYGLTKAPAGFARHVKEFFMSIFELTTKILAFIPGAQIAAAGMKIFSSIAGICEKAYAVGKGFYQSLFGEKKVQNSTSLLDDALSGKVPSLELILNLKLPSIEGSSFETVNWIKEKLHNISLENIGAADHMKSSRIIDQKKAETGERQGPPKNPQELLERMTQICKNPSSKELIRKEIQEAMTGYGK
ncbi:MAG: eCIS core domain-containing protein [Burkholderiales bacterium]